jgi:hypothetical protein
MTNLNELAIPITSMEQVEEWKKTWDGKSAIPPNIQQFLFLKMQKSTDRLKSSLDSNPLVKS